MDLTIQEVHSYNDLVKMGKEEQLQLSGVDNDTVVIPQLDEFDNVYFLDLASRAKIYPGINVIEKIKAAIDKHKNQE